MPTTVPVSTKVSGDIFSLAMWNNQLRDNLNKLLSTGHRVLTVAQFAALGAGEGTKGTVAPDEVYLEVDATNGIEWHLAYESGEATYKWRFLGGPTMLAEVTTDESTASGTYVALTTGVSLAVPRAGDYDVENEAAVYAASGTIDAKVSYDIGGTGAVDADAAFVQCGTSQIYSRRIRRKAALTAVTLTQKYKSSGGLTLHALNRSMQFKPVRLV